MEYSQAAAREERCTNKNPRKDGIENERILPAKSLRKISPLKSFALILLLAALALCLSGCQLHEKLLDEQLDLFVSSMNADDPSLLFSGMHPQVFREDFDPFYQQIKPLWRPVGAEDFKMTGVQVHTRQVNGERYGRYTGTWKVKLEEELYQLTIVYDVDEKGSGISTLSFYRIEETPLAVSVTGIALVILCFAFIIYTAVDILRKKPRAYILVLILAVALTFGFRAGTVQIAIPLGSIGYWVLRRRLLKKRSGDLASPLS